MISYTSADALMRDVDTAAAGAMVHRDAVHRLVAAAYPDREADLFALAFKAKFLGRTWNVMKRLGADDPARAQLKAVFYAELEAARSLIAMFSAGHDEVATRFLALEPPAFARLLELLHDLSWIQNVKLDTGADA